MYVMIAKVLISSLIIVAVSEIAKKNVHLGAVISALPIVSVLIMIWLFIENQKLEKISEYSIYTFWYVLPTMPMFLLFPWLISKDFSFWSSLALSSLSSIICFFITAFILRKFDIQLF